MLGQREKEGAAQELRQSLKKLETDYFDLYQFHALTTRTAHAIVGKCREHG